MSKTTKQEQSTPRNKGRKKYSNGKPNRQKRERGMSEEVSNMRSDPSDAINDASYYWSNRVVDTQLLNFSFNIFNGWPVSILDNEVPKAFSNIMRVEVNPAAGFSTPGQESTDGINMVSLQTYTYLSGTNAKTTNYQPQDVTMLLLAIGNILSNFSFGARALGMVGVINRRNRAYPKQAIWMAGFDYDDIKEHWADYRTRYNILVSRFNKIFFPANIKYLEKCIQMFSGVYLDEDGSDMAQSYILTPKSYWLFNESYDSDGSGLETKGFTGATSVPGVVGTACTYISNYGDFLDDLDGQVTALLTSTTFNYIFADVQRCSQKYGLPLLTLAEIPDGYLVMPRKEEELSLWINNATIMGNPELTAHTANDGSGYDYDTTKSNDVKCSVNKNCVIYRPGFNNVVLQGDFIRNLHPILNFKHDMPTDEEKILATRLHVLFKDTHSTTSPYYHRAAYPTLCDWYVTNLFTLSGDGNVKGSSSVTAIMLANNTNIINADNLSKFDWHPYVYFVPADATSPTPVLGDTQFYTQLDWQDMKAINDMAIQSLLELR